jgi:hypothetical protein
LGVYREPGRIMTLLNFHELGNAAGVRAAGERGRQEHTHGFADVTFTSERQT